MRILLHDTIAVTGDPDVVLVIDEAAVNAVGQHIPVAPGVHHASVGVEFDNGCRGDRIEGFGRVDQVSARHNEHVVPRIDAGSRDFAGRPWLGLACRRTEHERGSEIAGARQRHLRPRPVGYEVREPVGSPCIGLRNGQAQGSGHGQSYGTGVNITLSPHDDLLVAFVIQCGVNGTQDRSFWLFPRFARYTAACPWECTEQVVLRLLSYGNPTGSRITDSIAQAHAKIMLGRAPISVKPKPPPLRLISELELTVAVHNSSELHVRNMWGQKRVQRMPAIGPRLCENSSRE